jgi:hypothetical protein
VDKETVNFFIQRIGEGKMNAEGLSDEALVAIAANLKARCRQNANPSDKDIEERLSDWDKSKSIGLKELRRGTLARTLEMRIAGSSLVRVTTRDR